LKVDASFVRSAARAEDVPRDGAPQIALVGRSNVGKSSLINALVRQRVARTSAAPGKTRLANVYRVARAGHGLLYLVDLPGFGYAGGGEESARAFDRLVGGYFGREGPERLEGREGLERRAGGAALFLVDSRHPGLANDLAAWRWLQAKVDRYGIVATKVDKLSRAERQRAMRQLEAVHEHPVLPVSAVSGEGLNELWILIDKLANNPNRRAPSRPRPRSLNPLDARRRPPATAGLPRKRRPRGPTS
jgi:GTP-binding protein